MENELAETTARISSHREAARDHGPLLQTHLKSIQCITASPLMRPRTASRASERENNREQ
jgi:hypothetical protein